MLICPVLTSYRQHLYDGLCDYFEYVSLYADSKIGKGFESNKTGRFKFTHVDTFRFKKSLYYQKGILKAFLSEKPDLLFITQDFRAMNFWLILLVAKIYGVPLFLHTQGVYNKETRRSYFVYKFLYRCVAAMSAGYICYTESVKQGLLRAGVAETKLTVMDNTVWNLHPLPPDQKAEIQIRPTALYVGRLREGCYIPLLFDAMEILRESGHNLSLEIIGDGDQRSIFSEIAEERDLDIVFHGAIYDDGTITEISRKCMMGVYPGDAGLSVIHYMSISLVPITHSNLAAHMGPEPSFIVDGYNGLMFERGSAQDLARAISKLLEHPEQRQQMSRNAFSTYEKLGEISMEHKLASAMVGPLPIAPSQTDL
ncbi:MAG: hypothetical protein COA41_01870 [Sphingopyxis sp.]|nr:MAG: hypothetical protein COA41_01870 [Sphingopyxis sp.]